jgi:hypothetical protein
MPAKETGQSPLLLGSGLLAESGIGPQISDVQIRGDSYFALRDLKQGRANAKILSVIHF